MTEMSIASGASVENDGDLQRGKEIRVVDKTTRAIGSHTVFDREEVN